MKQLWWKETFSDAYLEAFDHIYGPERTQEEVRFVINALALGKGASLLDVACGQGRHSIAFAKQGLEVTGIDASAILLRAARKRAGQAGVKVDFRMRDMRAFRFGVRFDAAVILGNAFGYFSDEENERILVHCAAALKRGGQLLLDLPNTAGMLRGLQSSSKTVFSGGSLKAENLSFDPLTFVQKIRWTITLGKKIRVYCGSIRLYAVPEVVRMLAKAGFVVEKTLGSFRSAPFSIDSPRLLLVARKKSSANVRGRVAGERSF